MPVPRATGPDRAVETAGSRGVIGLGNPLRGDDGVVPALFARLRDGDMPEDADLLEFGDASLRLVHALESFDRVLVVDAMRFGGEPGEYVVCTPDEVVSRTASGVSHDPDLLEVVALARELGDGPDRLRIFGIEPGPMAMGPGLSAALEARLPALESALAEAIEQL